jgi:hypothetical protein
LTCQVLLFQSFNYIERGHRFNLRLLEGVTLIRRPRF